MATLTKIGKKWRAQIRIKGHPSKARTFDRKSDAQVWANSAEKQMRRGEVAVEVNLADFSIPALIKRYVDEIGSTKPFGRSKTGSLKMLCRHLTGVTLASLSAETVVAYAKKRDKNGAGGVTIGMELTYLGGILGVAKLIWKIPFNGTPIESARPVLKMLGLLRKSRERDRRPTEEEIAAICDYFDSKLRQRIPMSSIIKFAIATAMRASEITSLRWSDVNHADRTVLIRDRKHPNEKNGNNQTVPLLGDAYTIVTQQPQRSVPITVLANHDPNRPAHPSELIFPYNSKSFSSLFPKACRDKKISDLRFHDLRHEGISRLFEQGYSIPEVALVSGHRDWKMLRRYTQIRARDLHRTRPAATA